LQSDENLPGNLPLDPPQSESCYSFGLKTELVEEEGVRFAFNRNLEVCFETHKIPAEGACFSENEVGVANSYQKCSRSSEDLHQDADHDFLREVWLEWLIKAMEMQVQRCQRSELFSLKNFQNRTET